MTKTLKDLIASSKNGKLSTFNIQVIDKGFSNKEIHLPNTVLLNETFNSSFFKKSHLTKIRFYCGSFASSLFKDCGLENRTFSKGSVDGSEFQSCHFINTIFRNITFWFCNSN